MTDRDPITGDTPRPGSVELSILLVTYNSRDVLPGFLDTLSDHPPEATWELVVWDNASSDDSADVVQERFTTATVIRNPHNLGFAAGVNGAAARAVGTSLLMINPDVVWDAGFFDRLIASLSQHDKAGALTPKLCFPNGEEQLTLRRFPTHTNIWFSRGVPWARSDTTWSGRRTYTLSYPDEPEPIDAASGACLMVRAVAFRAVGGMDPEYFMYVEDTDLCRRLWDAGWEVWVDPALCVKHRWTSLQERSPLLRRYHRHSIRRYFRKFYPDKPIRNAVLFAALFFAGVWDRLTAASSSEPGSTR